MSLKDLTKKADSRLVLIETRRHELLKICALIDNEEDEKNRHYAHFREFCEILHEHEKNDDENCFNEGDTVQEVLNAVLIMKNYEYKIKMLKILLIYWDQKRIVSKDVYENVKKTIMSFLPAESFDSIFQMHENVIKSNCNRLFFELIFLIKESRLKRFEFKLEDFIEIHKKYYGEYWKHAMKFDARILCLTAENLNFYKTVEFMFMKCSFIELNSTILTEFEELGELCEIFGDNLNEDEKKFLVNLTYFLNLNFFKTSILLILLPKKFLF